MRNKGRQGEGSRWRGSGFRLNLEYRVGLARENPGLTMCGSLLFFVNQKHSAHWFWRYIFTFDEGLRINYEEFYHIWNWMWVWLLHILTLLSDVSISICWACHNCLERTKWLALDTKTFYIVRCLSAVLQMCCCPHVVLLSMLTVLSLTAKDQCYVVCEKAWHIASESESFEPPDLNDILISTEYKWLQLLGDWTRDFTFSHCQVNTVERKLAKFTHRRVWGYKDKYSVQGRSKRSRGKDINADVLWKFVKSSWT